MLKFDDKGLVPVVVQDASTGQVLTLAYMNDEALKRTLAGPDVWFYSRSRGTLWHKGETSGNFLRRREVIADCDSDAVLVKVEPTGPACHTGKTTCFHTPLGDTHPPVSPPSSHGVGAIAELAEVIADRRANPTPGSYTSKLFADGTTRIAQKVVEEAGETALAAVTDKSSLASEVADLLYHTIVLLESAGVPVDDVWQELGRRRK